MTALIRLDLFDEPHLPPIPPRSDHVAAEVAAARREYDLLPPGRLICPRDHLLQLSGRYSEQDFGVVLEQPANLRPGRRNGRDQVAVRGFRPGNDQRLEKDRRQTY